MRRGAVVSSQGDSQGGAFAGVNGIEWVIEAHGCYAGALTDVSRLRQLFDRIVEEMNLHPLGNDSWHQFPNTGGITGVALLRESHLACHTFPEYGSLCLNLFCCRERADGDFAGLIKAETGAASVHVRKIERPYGDVS